MLSPLPVHHTLGTCKNIWKHVETCGDMEAHVRSNKTCGNCVWQTQSGQKWIYLEDSALIRLWFNIIRSSPHLLERHDNSSSWSLGEVKGLVQNAQDSSLAMAPHSFCMKTLGPHLAARTAMVHTSINLEIKSHSAMLSCRSEDVKVLPLQLGHWKVKITSCFKVPTHQP